MAPEAAWVALQLRQTWDEGEEPQRFLLFDRGFFVIAHDRRRILHCNVTRSPLLQQSKSPGAATAVARAESLIGEIGEEERLFPACPSSPQ